MQNYCYIKDAYYEYKIKGYSKMQKLYIDIFTEEDEDYPDFRVIRPKEMLLIES